MSVCICLFCVYEAFKAVLTTVSRTGRGGELLSKLNRLIWAVKHFNKQKGVITIKQNHNSITSVCERCGKKGFKLSNIKLICNYGSKYEGEILNLDICGKCADKIFDTIIKQ